MKLVMTKFIFVEFAEYCTANLFQATAVHPNWLPGSGFLTYILNLFNLFLKFNICWSRLFLWNEGSKLLYMIQIWNLVHLA
jgi:hypothetical protein